MVKTTEFNVQTQMNYIVGNMSGFTAAYTGMDNLSALLSSLMTSYTTMAGTGRAAYLSLGAAISAVGLKSAEAFGEYQRGMNMVKAISNNTNAQMQMLSQSAQQFSGQFRMGIEDINDGLVTLGRAGLTDVNNQIEVLKNGLQVAKISGMDLASTLEDIVTTTSLLGGDIKSNTFGAETKEISNLLVATSLSGPLNVSDVIETLKFAGGSAAAAGATLSNEEGLHDLLGTIGAFSQKGVTGSIAGTALRAFITKPASQDQKVSDALAKLGLDAYSLWEKDPEQGWHMKPIAEQIGMITKAMNDNHLTNLDRIEVWGDIVGNKMGQQMLKLDENRIKETTKDIEHQRNLEDIYQGTLTNFASQVERLNQIFQAIYRNVGSGFASMLTGIVQGFADVLEFLNSIGNGVLFKVIAPILGPLGLYGLGKGLKDFVELLGMLKANIQSSLERPIKGQALYQPYEDWETNRRGGSNNSFSSFSPNQSSIGYISSNIENIKSIRSNISAINSRAREIATKVNNQYRKPITYDEKAYEAVEQVRAAARASYDPSLRDQNNPFSKTSKYDLFVDDPTQYTDEEWEALKRYESYERGATHVGKVLFESGALLDDKLAFTDDAVNRIANTLELSDDQRQSLLSVARSIPEQMKQWYDIPMTDPTDFSKVNPKYAEKMLQLLIKRGLSALFTVEFPEYKDFGEFTDKGMNKALFKEYTNIPVSSFEAKVESGNLKPDTKKYNDAKAEAYKIKGSMSSLGAFNFLSNMIYFPEILDDAEEAAKRGLEGFKVEGEIQNKVAHELELTEENIRNLIPYLEQAAYDAGHKSVLAYLKGMGIASPGTEAKETKAEQERIEQSYIEAIPSVSAAAAQLAQAQTQAYQDFLVFDVETTGVDFSGKHGLKGNDAIIQIGAAHFVGEEVSSVFKTGGVIGDDYKKNNALINRQVDGTENIISKSAQQANTLSYDRVVNEGGSLIDEAEGLREFVTYLESLFGMTIAEAEKAGKKIKALAHNGVFDMGAFSATIERVNEQLIQMGRTDELIPDFTKVLDFEDTMDIGRKALTAKYGFMPIQGLGPEGLMSLGYLFTQEFDGQQTQLFMGNEKLETYGWLTGTARKEHHDSLLDSIDAGKSVIILQNGNLPNITPVFGANIDAERDSGTMEYFTDFYDEYQYLPADAERISDIDAYQKEVFGKSLKTPKQVEIESKAMRSHSQAEIEQIRLHNSGTNGLGGSISTYTDQTYGDKTVSLENFHEGYRQDKINMLNALKEQGLVSAIEKLENAFGKSLTQAQQKGLVEDTIPSIFGSDPNSKYSGLSDIIGSITTIVDDAGEAIYYAYDDIGNVKFGTEADLKAKDLTPDHLKLDRALDFYFNGKDPGGILVQPIKDALADIKNRVNDESLFKSREKPSSRDVHHSLLRLLNPDEDILDDINKTVNTEMVSQKVRNYEGQFNSDDIDQIMNELVVWGENDKVVGLTELGKEFSKDYLNNRKRPYASTMKKKIRELLKEESLDKKYMANVNLAKQESNAGQYWDDFAGRMVDVKEDELSDDELISTRFKEGNMVDRILDGEFENLDTVEKMVEFVNKAAGMKVWNLEKLDDKKGVLSFNKVDKKFQSVEAAAQALKQMEDTFKKANPEGFYYNYNDVRDESFKTIQDIPLFRDAMAQYEKLSGEAWNIDEDLQWVSARDNLRAMQYTAQGRARIGDLKQRAVAGWWDPDIDQSTKFKAAKIAQERALDPQANMRQVMGVVIDSAGQIIDVIDDVAQVTEEVKTKTKLDKDQKPKKTLEERINKQTVNREAELKSINKFKQDLNTALENKDLSNIMDLHERAGSLEGSVKKAFNMSAPESVIDMINSVEEMTITVENLYNEAQNQQNNNARRKLLAINDVLNSMFQRIQNELAMDKNNLPNILDTEKEKRKESIDMVEQELNSARERFEKNSGLFREIAEEEQEERKEQEKVIKEVSKKKRPKKTKPKRVRVIPGPKGVTDFDPMQWAAINYPYEAPGYVDPQEQLAQLPGINSSMAEVILKKYFKGRISPGGARIDQFAKGIFTTSGQTSWMYQPEMKTLVWGLIKNQINTVLPQWLREELFGPNLKNLSEESFAQFLDMSPEQLRTQYRLKGKVAQHFYDQFSYERTKISSPRNINDKGKYLWAVNLNYRTEVDKWLDSIPQIGEYTRTKLRAKYRTLEALFRAPYDEIEKLIGSDNLGRLKPALQAPRGLTLLNMKEEELVRNKAAQDSMVIAETFEQIQGVGEKSIQRLQKGFTNLNAVLNATYDEIQAIIGRKDIANLIWREISRINSSQQDYINLPTQKTKTAEQFLNERKLKANIMPLTPTEAKKQLDRLSNVTFVNLTRDANAELRKKLFGDIFEQPVHEPELKAKKRIVSAPISDPSRELRMKIFGNVFRNAGKNITKSQISPEQKLQQRNQRAIEKWTQELIKGSMTQEQYAALLEGLTLSGQNFEVELQNANANLLKFSNELLTGTFEDDAARDELRGKIQQEIATIETLNEAKRRETTASIAAAEADRQESVAGRLSGFASAVGGMAGKLANGMFGLMMNPYVMVAQMVWGYVQQGIEMIRQQEEEKIAKLSEIASNAESSYDEQTSKWEEAQSKANEKFGDLSDNEKQDQMLEAIQKAREDNNSASAETKALLGKQNALISSSDNMINAKMNQRLTGYKGVQANWEEFMQGSGMVGSKDEFGLMDYLEGLINPDKFKNDSNTARIQAMADATIQIDTRVKNMEEMTEDYQKVMASFGVAGRSMLDIYNVRGILSDDFFSGTFFDPNSSQRIGAPGFRSAEQLAMLMKKEEKILQRFENRYLRFARTSTSKGDRITVTLGEGSIHNLANQLGVKDVEAAQMLAVHELQRIQDVMLNQVEPELAQTAISMYQGAYTLEQNKNLNDVQAAFQNTMTQGIFAIQAQVAQLVYKATMEQALSDYQAATGDTETDTIGLLLNRARDTSYKYHDEAKQFASQGWGGFMQARDLNHLVNQGYTQEEAMNKLLEQGKDGDYYKKLYGEQLGKYEYNGNNFGMEVFKFLSPLLGNELEGYLNYNNYDEFSKYTDWMMKSYAGEVPLDQAIKTLNDAQTAADEEGNNGKDTDDSDANKQRYVQLAICNKKAIPKLNVNLFKKAPTFTVLNKNFKLRDIKINTADKAKNIENSLKNAIIDVQERSDPKIIQDSEGEYDPVGATDDATNLPTGASLTK